MQVNITQQEQQALNYLASGRGRAQWVRESAGISYPTLRRLRREGVADKEVVDKARAFLQSEDAIALLSAQRKSEPAA